MINDFFKFDENNTDLKTEIFAGITTFLAMAYILGVNPVILGDAGMPQSGVFFATAFVSAIASILMGLFSKYPLAIAPGMGYNALFSYTIVIGMGKSWEVGLAAVFVSSLVFLFAVGKFKKTNWAMLLLAIVFIIYLLFGLWGGSKLIKIFCYRKKQC